MIEKEESVIASPFLDQQDSGALAMAQLNKELEDCRDQLNIRDKELAERFDEIATLTRLLLESDQSIAEITAQADDYHSKASNFSEQLSEITTLVNDVEFEDDLGDNLLIKIEFLCRLNRTLDTLLIDKNQQVEALQNLQTTLQATLELRNQTLNELSTQIEAKDSHLETLLVQNALLKDELDAAYKSISWRVTAPLRFIKKLLRSTAQ